MLKHTVYMWHNLPDDIIFQHILPFSYCPQSKDLLEDIKSYVKTYDAVKYRVQDICQDQQFLEEYAMEEYGMGIHEFSEDALTKMASRWFFFKLIHSNVYEFLKMSHTRRYRKNIQWLTTSNFHKRPIAQQFRILWGMLDVKERTQAFSKFMDE